MMTVFHGEGNTVNSGSGLMGVNAMHTPPSDDDEAMSNHFDAAPASRRGRRRFEVTAWLEFYHWTSGVSFRAFLVDDGDSKSLFAFFDEHAVMRRELKSAVVALLELADFLDCVDAVTCIDRRIPADEAKALIKGLQWANFELRTLDRWGTYAEPTSKRWVVMGCDI
jgi:hypothetical protein